MFNKNLLTRIKAKVNYLIIIFLNYIKAFLYFIFKNYGRFKNPQINDLFCNKLTSPDSNLVKLLSLNKNAVIDADNILMGKLKVFNLNINLQTDSSFWHTDFHSGIKYPKLPYNILNNSSYIKRGADIIFPWELSRMQFIPTLIQAFLLTNNKKYILFFENTFKNWIEHNPYRIGVNWKTSMDVGIRAINVGLALIFFQKHINTKNIKLFWKILWAHHNYLIKTIIKKKITRKHNHYMVSIISLIFLSNLFAYKKYLEKIYQEFKIEIDHQFNSDGGNIESSNHYHQLTLETVLIGLFFAKEYEEHGDNFFDFATISKVMLAIQFVNIYMATFKRSPQFGDSDDGRIIIFNDYFNWDKLNHYFINDIYLQLFPTWKIKHNENIYLFPESGFGFFSNNRYGICLANSVNRNQLYRGHNHFDKSSFVFQVKGEPIFIDSGTYCYTSNLETRNQHKISKAHNVITIDENEQAGSNFENAFSIPEAIETSISLKENDTEKIFEMVHSGFERLKNLGVIKRKIKCLPLKVIINDHIEGSNKHLVKIFYNIAPNIKFEIGNSKIIFFKGKSYLCELLYSEFLSVEIERGFYSPSYYIREEINRLVLYSNIELPCEITTTLQINSNN